MDVSASQLRVSEMISSDRSALHRMVLALPGESFRAVVGFFVAGRRP